MIAQIKNIMQIGKEYILTLTTSDITGLESLSEVELKKVTKKRSLSANAYFHVLSGMIADKLGVSKAYAKNFLLARYGQRETDENGEPVQLAVKEDIDLMEREDIHTALVGTVIVSIPREGYCVGSECARYGLDCFGDTDCYQEEKRDVYEVVRGSHTYTSEEMSVLINGTISEAKEIGGIEVLPPHELARMYAQVNNHK